MAPAQEPDLIVSSKQKQTNTFDRVGEPSVKCWSPSIYYTRKRGEHRRAALTLTPGFSLLTLAGC